MRCWTVKSSQLRVAMVTAIDIQLEVGIHLNFDYSRLSTDHIRMNVYRSYTDGERTTARRQNKNQLKLTMHKRSPNKQQHNEKQLYRAWFSRLSRHPARKWSRSIITTQEPARGSQPPEKGTCIIVINDSNTDYTHTNHNEQKLKCYWMLHEIFLIIQEFNIKMIMTMTSGWRLQQRPITKKYSTVH